MSQENLAFAAGLDRTYISLLELGQHSPTLDTMLTLCRALKVPFDDMARLVDAKLQRELAAPSQSGRDESDKSG